MFLLLDQEITTLATLVEVPLVAGTRFGQSYLKQYDNSETIMPQSLQEHVKQRTKPSVEKTKEF